MKNRKVNNVSVGRALALAGALLAVGSAVGCGDSGDVSFGNAPAVDCDSVTPKGFAALKPVFDKCTTCHSVNVMGAAREAAPIGTDYDDLAGAKEEYANIANRVYDTGTPMPPAGKPVLTDAEKADLNAWAQCGTPP